MRQRVLLVSILTASACLAICDVRANPATPPGLEAIVGTFNCVTHESGGTVWHFHSSNHAWGAWVQVETSFAAQNGQPADVASVLVGFDAKAKQWNIISADIDGSYYTRSSRSQAFAGSHWVDRYPADGATAVIGVRGKRQYTFDLVSAGANGHAESSHTVCTRV